MTSPPHCYKILSFGQGFGGAPNNVLSGIEPINGNLSLISSNLISLMERSNEEAGIIASEINYPEGMLNAIEAVLGQGIDISEPDQFFYHTDHLGSSSWITDANGIANQHYQYLPFGEDYVTQTPTGAAVRYTFSAKEKDTETGYSYFGARYYDSDLSVWLSVDPMSDRLPFISPYSYCYNHPVNYKDPDGKFPWLAGIIGGAINIGIQYSISKWQDEEYDFKKEALGDFANGFLVASGGGVIAKLGLTITKAAVYTAVNLGLASGLDESIDHCFAGEADIKRVFEESVWGLATGMAGGEYSKKTVNFLNKIADKKVKELSKRELNSYLRIQEKNFTKELKNKGYKTSGKEFKRQLGTRLQNSEEVKLAEINFWKGTAEKTASGGVQISIDYIGTVGKDKLEKIK